MATVQLVQTKSGLSWQPPIRATRFPELGFVNDAPGLWRFVTTEDESRVGQLYRTKAELLADLERYAREYGL